MTAETKLDPPVELATGCTVCLRQVRAVAITYGEVSVRVRWEHVPGEGGMLARLCRQPRLDSLAEYAAVDAVLWEIRLREQVAASARAASERALAEALGEDEGKISDGGGGERS